MISFLLYSREKKELNYIKEKSLAIHELLQDEDLFLNEFSEKKELEMFVDEHPIVDISCLDIVASGGLRFAEKVHENNERCYTIIIATPEISPIVYMRPTVMASSLLLRPLTKRVIDDALRDAFIKHLKNKSKRDMGNLLFSTRDGDYIVPYEQVNYFEARNKKIIINTYYNEYSFFSTLDKLSENLPKGFVRCHRSFIVAIDKVKLIVSSKSIIVLRNGYEIPISRSYKSNVKEIREWTLR